MVGAYLLCEVSDTKGDDKMNTRSTVTHYTLNAASATLAALMLETDDIVRDAMLDTFDAWDYYQECGTFEALFHC